LGRWEEAEAEMGNCLSSTSAAAAKIKFRGISAENGDSGGGGRNVNSGFASRTESFRDSFR
jgi:hypothetical protein